MPSPPPHKHSRAQRALALFAAALALAASPRGARAAVCFDEWQCIFHWLDAAKTTEYSYDLRPLCAASDRVFSVTTPEGYNWQVRYAVCGNVSTACNPSWTHAVSRGNVVQDLLTAPSPGTMTTDPETGQSVPATNDCEVLGHTRPEFDLLDESNPATGGIVLKHSSLPPSSSDKYQCPTDPRTGYPRERVVSIVMLCDPSLPVSQLREVSFAEVKPQGGLGTCIYNLTLRSGAACGAAGDPYDPAGTSGGGSAAASADCQRLVQVGVPGTNFGYVVLGTFLCVAAQAAFGWLRERGLLDRILPGRAGLPTKAVGGGGGGGGGGVGAGAALSPRYGAL